MHKAVKNEDVSINVHNLTVFCKQADKNMNEVSWIRWMMSYCQTPHPKEDPNDPFGFGVTIKTNGNGF